MSTSEPDSSALRAALEQLVDALSTPSEGSEPEHLARVRAAEQVRRLAAEDAEHVLDKAIVNARHAHPEGATWAELGAVLGTTGQAVSKRAGQRAFTRQRRQLSAYERAQRKEQRYREKFGDDLPPQWRFTEAFENPSSPSTTPAKSATSERLAGSAFWRAQARPRD